VNGFAPLTCRLQEARFVAICALTALMAQVIALIALIELEFPSARPTIRPTPQSSNNPRFNAA
jgi:hypothetical protein